MRGARVDLQLAKLLGAETVARQHPLDGPAVRFFGPRRGQLPERLLLEAVRVSAVAYVELRLQLVARHRDAGRVDHDHVVAGVDMGGEGRLVLALEDTGDARREAAERLVRRPPAEPAAPHLALPRRIS